MDNTKKDRLFDKKEKNTKPEKTTKKGSVKRSVNRIGSALSSETILTFIGYIVIEALFVGLSSLAIKYLLGILGYNTVVTTHNKESYLEIITLLFSVVLLSTSLMAMLSERNLYVYWVDIIERVLIEPKLYSFVALATYAFSAAVFSCLGFVFRCGALVISGFIYGMIDIVFLFFRMISIYYMRERYKSKIKQDFGFSVSYAGLVKDANKFHDIKAFKIDMLHRWQLIQKLNEECRLRQSFMNKYGRDFSRDKLNRFVKEISLNPHRREDYKINLTGLSGIIINNAKEMQYATFCENMDFLVGLLPWDDDASKTIFPSINYEIEKYKRYPHLSGEALTDLLEIIEDIALELIDLEPYYLEDFLYKNKYVPVEHIGIPSDIGEWAIQRGIVNGILFSIADGI